LVHAFLCVTKPFTKLRNGPCGTPVPVFNIA
jgi:hypothetical protein